MRSRVFLVVGILLLSFGVMVVGTGGPFGVTKPEGGYETGVAGRSYPVTSSGKVEIIDNEGTVTSFFENFKSGSATMDESGKVMTFKGITELGAALVINGKGYSNLPAGAEFEYEEGATSVKSDENFLYDNNPLGGSGSATTISGDETINIDENGVVSSKGTVKISNINGDTTLSPIDGGEMGCVLDENGGVAYVDGNTEMTLEDYGVSASNPGKGFDVSWDDKCSTQNSCLYVKDDQIGFNSVDVEVGEENAFFKKNEGSGPVRFSGDGNTLIEKDMATINGNVEVTNGGNLIKSDDDGNLYSSIIDGPEAAMPMTIYSSENGVTADYSVEVTEDGALGVEKVGLVDQGKYLVNRGDGGTYEMSGEEVLGESVSEALSFDGNFGSGEEVTDYTLCVGENDGKNCRTLSYSERGLFTTERKAWFHDKCAGLGVDCGSGQDHTQTVKDLYAAAKNSGEKVSGSCITNKGNKYEF